MNKWMLCATMLAAMLCFQSCKDEEGRGVENGYEWVDLGLSVKWATCNVGAEKAEHAGDYFVWGEVLPKDFYAWNNSLTMGDKTIGAFAGDAQYDAATYNWGGSWRMPTGEEIQELVQNCTWEWTLQNDRYGCRATSVRNGNSIFLPAAGYSFASTLDHAGQYGYYLSATPYGDEEACEAYCLLFGSQLEVSLSSLYRVNGHSVRPVVE